MPILQIPRVLQSADFDCATACMTALVRFHKTRGAVLSDLASPEAGMDPATVELIFRKAGWKVNAGERSLDDLQSNCLAGRPVMCLITREGEGHWIVVAGVTPRRIYFHDPLEGMRFVTHVEFLEFWHDIGRYGATFHNFGMVAWK